MCALLANLLDNALEAARTQVDIKISQKQGMLFIQISNYYRMKPVWHAGQFAAEKSEGRHGWGLKNVRQIVLKYGERKGMRVQIGFVTYLVSNDVYNSVMEEVMERISCYWN